MYLCSKFLSHVILAVFLTYLVARVKQLSSASHSINPLRDSLRGLGGKGHEWRSCWSFSTCIKMLTTSKPGRSITVCLKTCAAKWKPNTSNFVATHGSPVAITRSRCSACLWIRPTRRAAHFSKQHNESMARFFTDETWVARLAYLADILNIWTV